MKALPTMIDDLIETRKMMTETTEQTVRTPKGFYLGQHVKEMITKRTGVVIILSESANGAWHLFVQPKELNKDGEAKGLFSAAESRFIRIEEVEELLEEPTFETSKLQMFDEVKVVNAPIQGQIRGIDYHITGCIRYHVKTSDINTFGSINTHDFDPDEIQLVKSATLPAAPSTTPLKKRRSPEFIKQISMRERLMAAGAAEDILRGCPVDC